MIFNHDRGRAAAGLRGGEDAMPPFCLAGAIAGFRLNLAPIAAEWGQTPFIRNDSSGG